jgi:cytochrome c biogenesis protein CcmG/thiol:disulfide interchange protein DsbE
VDRLRLVVVSLVVVIAGCGGGGADISAVPELELVTPEAIEAMLAGSADPVLLNVWASWCIPCRSEAPLLLAAHERFGDEVTFIGVDVRDNQDDARAFIAEFGLDAFPHLFDNTGAVPAALGGRGVPLTFFFEAGGELSYLHRGVIDERTLAVHLDELTR